MIHSRATIAAVGLADELADKGLILTTVPNTVLNELVRLTNDADVGINIITEESHSAGSKDKFIVYSNFLEDVTKGTLEQPSRHDLYSDNVINDLSKAILGHISFAKNVVKPAIMAYSEELSKELEKNKPLDPTSAFNIIILDQPELFSNKEFINSLDKYEGKIPLAPNSFLSLPDKAFEDICSLMQFGETNTDNAINQWIERKGIDFFKSIWSLYFGDGKASVDSRGVWIEPTYPLASNCFEAADFGLAIYLIGNRLYNSVDENATRMTLAGYRNIVAKIRDFGGALITKAISGIAALEKTKLLVIDTQPETYTCKVVGNLYRDWLTKDGRPEYLFGMLLSNFNYTTIEKIDEYKNELLKQWNSFMVYHNSAQANKRFSIFKDTAELVFNLQMNDLPAIEKEFELHNPTYRVNVTKYLKEELAKLRTPDINNIDEVALKLICNTRFYYTDAYKILAAINDAAKINPNIDVREAALIATIEYIVDFISEQMKVQPH